MNNFMNNLKMLQQQSQQYQQRPQTHPISQGAREAMNAARQSVELNDEQRNRSMGAGLMGLFSNMQAPAPNTGLAGAIGMINSGMNPAIQNYMNQYNREQDFNREIANKQQAMQMHQEEQAYKRSLDAQELAYKLAKMEEDRSYNNRYLDVWSGRPSGGRGKEQVDYEELASKKNDLISKGILPENAILLSEVPNKRLQEDYIKDMRARANQLVPLGQNIKNVRKIREIAEKNPEIWNSIGKITSASLDEDPSVFNNILSTLSREDVVAAQKIKKLTSDILANEVQANPGRTTDIMKKVLSSSLPSVGLTPEANRMVLDSLEEKYSFRHGDAKKTQTGLRYGAWFQSPDMLEEPSEGNAIPQKREKYSPEEIKQLMIRGSVAR